MSHMSPPDENRRRLVTWLGVLLLTVSFALFLAALTRNLILGSREGRDAIADLLSRSGILAPTPSSQVVGPGEDVASASASMTPTAIAVSLPTGEASGAVTAEPTLSMPTEAEVMATATHTLAASPTPAPTMVAPTVTATVVPPTAAPTATPTAAPSATATQTALPPSPTVTWTVAPTLTATAPATATAIPSATARPTETATPTYTPTLQPPEAATSRPTLRRPTRVRPATPAWTPAPVSR